MSLPWMVSVAAFIASCVGAYVGSYLKRKGENLATHEDIDRLVDQVRAVTTATKEIEAKISSDLWDRQKQWELKRDILFDAAKRMADVQNKLLSLNTFWGAKLRGEIEGQESRIRLEKEYVTGWQNSSRSFEEVLALIQVACSRETMRAFAELDDVLRTTAAKIVSDDLETYSRLEGERDRKFAMAALAIRRELGISA